MPLHLSGASPQLGIEVAEGLSGTFDRDQLNQAIWALLQNAVEAAGTARPSVRLSATADDAALTIDVADDGCGVPAERAGIIFRPFVTTKVAGTGIGLSLARQIVQGHGGTLHLFAESPTVFHLRIPKAS